MSTRRFMQTVAATAVLFFYPALASAGAYSLTVAGERLEFVPQPQKGYVIKLAEKAGGIHALAGISALDAEGAREIGGLDRHGVWTVENTGPAERNEDAIRSHRASGQVAYAAPLFSSNGEIVAIIPEIVVRVKPGTDSVQVGALCEKAGCRIKKRMEFTQQEYLLEVLGPDAEAVFAAVEQLGRAPEVEWACPNTAFRPKLASQAVSSNRVPSDRLGIASAGQDANTPGVFPNDPYFPKQWHLHNTGQSGGTPGADIRAPEAWEITTGDPNIVVAVVDNGVDSKHPDLVNNLVRGHDFLDGDDAPDPAKPGVPIDGHGTCCAGIIAAEGNNSIGVAGVTWGCKIMALRVNQGEGEWETDETRATALRWAAVNGADVLSNSYGDAAQKPITHSAILDVTREDGIGRRGKGCIVLFASGNSYTSLVYPAKYPEVISVGATDHNDMRCSYSCHGPELDIVAPSGWQLTSQEWTASKGRGALWTTDIIGPEGLSSAPLNATPEITDYFAINGTSGACPVAAGVAALILSLEPNLTGAEVRHFLERSAKDLGDPGRDDYYGWGRVDARAALDMVLAKRADLNNDWQVDEADRAILMKAIEVNDLSGDIAPAAKCDGKVDQQDLALLMRYMGTVIPELGLIAHWKLDETEGMIAHDIAGKKDATVIGTPLWQPESGKVGGAIQLDGIDDYVSTPFVVNPVDQAFSVFAWIKGGGPGQAILSQVGGANWLMAADPGGALMTDLKLGGRRPQALTSAFIITDGDWHRVGLSWDGSNRILYVDDMEVAKDTQASLPSSTGGLYIGAGSKVGAGTFWKGLIDDVRVYNRAVAP